MRNETSPSRDSLVRSIHAAGADARHWPGVLQQLREALGASVVTLGRHEFASGADSAWFESPTDLNFSRDFAAYAARNPWFLSSEDYVAGRVISGDELLSAADLRRTDFYRGFLRPRGLLHRLCGVVAQRNRGAFLLSAFRREDQGAFGASERAELEYLLGHVTLSLESHWRWQEADDLARALMTLIEQDSNPTILVTAQAEPVFRNPAAERLLELRAGLGLEGPCVVAASQADQRLLRDAIARVAQAEPGHDGAGPRVLTLACLPPAPPIVLVVRPAGQVFDREAGVQRGLALLTVRSGHARHDPATCAFARQYELTAAQAKVSALVFAGQSLASIAHTLNVSENTVRSHLKQIFQKTDTHGQMDLVHLHARVCSSMP